MDSGKAPSGGDRGKGTETYGVIIQIDREEGRRGEKVLPGIDHKKD